MPSSSVAVRGLALAVLAIAAAPAFAQDVVVQPARVPVAGASGTYERNLPAPPPGPIESRLVSVAAGGLATAAPAVTFIGRSVALTPATKGELDQIARRIADQKFGHIELRAFAAD